MAGLEFVGVLTRLLLSVPSEENTRKVITDYFELVREYRKQGYNMFTSLVLLTVFAPDASRLIRQIDEYMKQEEPHEVKDFIRSYDSGFSMTGVAGAIVAQISLQAFDPDDDDDGSDSMHWIVNACYVAALMCSTFSVATACLALPTLKALTTTERTKEWLSKDGKGKHPSAYSVMMLLAPNRLLSIAISALLVGFGIMLGLLYTKGKAKSFGRFGELAVLLTYILTSLFGLAIFFIPWALKEIETRKARVNQPSRSIENHTSGQLPGSSHRANPDVQLQHIRRGQRPQTFPTTMHRHASDEAAVGQELHRGELLSPGRQRRNSSVSRQLSEGGHSERTQSRDRLLSRRDPAQR